MTNLEKNLMLKKIAGIARPEVRMYDHARKKYEKSLKDENTKAQQANLEAMTIFREGILAYGDVAIMLGMERTAFHSEIGFNPYLRREKSICNANA